MCALHCRTDLSEWLLTRSLDKKRLADKGKFGTHGSLDEYGVMKVRPTGQITLLQYLLCNGAIQHQCLGLKV